MKTTPATPEPAEQPPKAHIPISKELRQAFIELLEHHHKLPRGTINAERKKRQFRRRMLNKKGRPIYILSKAFKKDAMLFVLIGVLLSMYGIANSDFVTSHQSGKLLMSTGIATLMGAGMVLLGAIALIVRLILLRKHTACEEHLNEGILKAYDRVKRILSVMINDTSTLHTQSLASVASSQDLAEFLDESSVTLAQHISPSNCPTCSPRRTPFADRRISTSKHMARLNDTISLMIALGTSAEQGAVTASRKTSMLSPSGKEELLRGKIYSRLFGTNSQTGSSLVPTEQEIGHISGLWRN